MVDVAWALPIPFKNIYDFIFIFDFDLKCFDIFDQFIFTFLEDFFHLLQLFFVFNSLIKHSYSFFKSFYLVFVKLNSSHKLRLTINDITLFNWDRTFSFKSFAMSFRICSTIFSSLAEIRYLGAIFVIATVIISRYTHTDLKNTTYYWVERY